MLDIGWPELMIVALVTIIVVGPKELPRVLRTVTQLTRKVRAMASEFQSGIDDLAREAELDELKDSIEKVATKDIAGELENQIDPAGEVTKSMQEIETSLNEDSATELESVADKPAEPAVSKAEKGLQDNAGKKPKPAKPAKPAKRKNKASGKA